MEALAKPLVHCALCKQIPAGLQPKWKLGRFVCHVPAPPAPDRGGRPWENENRAKRSGDDLEARGIFEFSTTVVLGVFRQQPVQNRRRNLSGNKEQFYICPKIQNNTCRQYAPVLINVKTRSHIILFKENSAFFCRFLFTRRAGLLLSPVRWRAAASGTERA